MTISDQQSPPPDDPTERRRRWLSVLAKSPGSRLRSLWSALGAPPDYVVVRRPEVGLVMVQGRTSGAGAAFCAGEMTATRAAVRLAGGQLGIGYAGGRDRGKVEIIAVVDALGALPEWRARIETMIVEPLAKEHEDRRRMAAGRVAATKVEFFTVAREAAA